MKAVLCTLNAKYIHPSLALRYLERYCWGPSWRIETMEFTINQPLDDIRTRLYLSQPDVLSFSCYIWNIEPILALCRDLKPLIPDCIFILGGPEVSFDASSLLERFDNIGIIIRGEGEISLKQVLEHIAQGRSLADIDGISYREDSIVYNNPDRELIKDLDTIPSAFDSDMSEYHDRLLYYESSRGCPFNCSYCLSSTFDGVRTFSMDRVKNDLRLVMESGAGTVKFVDRTFNCHEKRAREIIEFIVDNNISTKFHFEVCADLISDEFMSFLLEVPAETFSFEIGIQSTYLPALEAVNRRCDMQRFMSNVSQLAERGNIHLHIDLIAGLPWERYIDFKKSFNQVYKLYPDIIQLGFLKMLKGSSIRKEADHYGYIYQELPPYQVLSSDFMEYHEFIQLSYVERLLDRYYNSGAFKNSIRYITDIVYDEKPFDFFEDFAYFCEKQDWFMQGHNRSDEYNILMAFIEEKQPEHKGIINEYLKYDFVLNNRHNPLPKKLQGCIAAERTREKLYTLLRNRDFVNQILPEWSNLSKYDLSKRVQLELFSLDPTNIIKQNNENITILFVYPINQRKADRVIFIDEKCIDRI